MKIRKKIILLLFLCVAITLVSACNSQSADLTFTNQQAISAGPFQLVGLKEDGTVVCFTNTSIYRDSWGDAEKGQFDVSSWTDIVSVDAGGSFEFGYFFVVGLKSDGTVVFTDNSMPGTENRVIDQRLISKWKDIIAVSAGVGFVSGLKSDGTVISTDESGADYNSVKNWENIKAISAGQHLIGLKQDGTVVATAFVDDGDESFLGDVSSWVNIISVSAGYNSSVGLKQDGTVVATGWRDYLYSSVYDWKDIIKVYNGGNYAIGLKKDGTVVTTSEAPDLSKWKDISAIAACADITAGLKNDGTVVVYGLDGDFSS
ncbi:chromosome condensation regulator [Tissierella creatinini]|nr:chromosome condensation regulator [Tissierella creatinini]TJX59711.1 chromosome condensation regulator [Soehngenia saccharolytica]